MKGDAHYQLCSMHIGTEVKFTGKSASLINIDFVVKALEDDTAE